MEVIPAIDLRGGRVVRLAQGDFSRETVYDDSPGDVARSFTSQGAPRLHVVDLDGARQGRPENVRAIAAVLAAAGPIPVQVGGGVRSLESVTDLLGAGADRVVIGTAALEQPALLREAASRYPGRIVLGLDVRDGRVAVRAWREIGRDSAAEMLERFADLPLAAVLHTDVARDGMLQGPNLEATRALAERSPFPVIASGGVHALADVRALRQTRVIAGVIVGRALYAGAFALADALQESRRC